MLVDSQLVVRQVTRKYEVKDPIFKAYNGLVKQLWKKFSQIQLVQIPREKNTRADKLSRVDSTDPKAIKGILVEVLNRSSTAKELVMTIDAPDWRNSIIEYLKSLAIEIDSESVKLRI